MKNRWSDSGAKAAIGEYGSEWGESVALRVYTSRLIGQDAALVLHGGGNTSVKADYTNLLGETVEAIYVKGSGANLDAMVPRGLPALDLAYLRRLRGLRAMSDEEMVNQLRTHLFDATAPNPSVETLLHAFLPHRFVDHSHADAILALTNQPDGEALVREVMGPDVLVLPYIMPGFPLALAVAEAIEKQPQATGAVLLKHGLFTFGDSARESYERHIELVDQSERYLDGKRRRVSLAPKAADTGERVARVAPILRGLLANRDAGDTIQRFVMEWRGAASVLSFCEREDAATLAATGPLTPDHVIRTKERPVFVADPAWDHPERLRAQLEAAVADFRRDYDAYFEQNLRAKGIERTQLDNAPRVVLLPGAGALCFGKSKKEARVAADITDHTLATKALAEDVGQYQALASSDLFDMEYWSLEQAKLGKAAERPLERQVVLITGGAGAMGVGIGEVCAAAGAHVVFADIDLLASERAASEIESRHGSGSAIGITLDVTDDASTRACFDSVARHYGGVDVVVPNAGVAHVAPISDLDPNTARRLMDVNYLGVLRTLREAERVFSAQGTGGNIVLISSKNVFAPGKDFGAYSASKAAAHQIAKIAAMELAPLQVRVNMINADAVFSEGDVQSGLWKKVGPDRARSRGLDLQALPDFYKERNLLKTRVSARHVGRAVVFFASQQTPTTGATLPVDGGVVEAFPR